MANAFDRIPAGNAFDAVSPEKPRGALGEIGAGIKRGVIGQLPQMAGQAIQWASDEGKPAFEYGKEMAENAQARLDLPENQLHPEQHGTIVNALASGAEQIAPSLAPAAAIAGGLALLPEAAIAAPVAAGIAAIGGAVPAAMSQGEQTRQAVKKAGGTDEAARIAGWKSAAIEGGGEAVANRLTLGMGGLGKKAAGAGIDSMLGNAVDRSVLKPWAKATGAAMVGEPLTEMAQNYGEAQVEKNAGVDTQPWEQAKATIAPTLGMTALLAPFGLVGHYQNSKRAGVIDQVLTDPEAAPETRAAVVDRLYRDAVGLGIPDAGAWREGAMQDIEAGLPVRRESAAPVAPVAPAASNETPEQEFMRQQAERGQQMQMEQDAKLQDVLARQEAAKRGVAERATAIQRDNEIKSGMSGFDTNGNPLIPDASTNARDAEIAARMEEPIAVPEAPKPAPLTGGIMSAAADAHAASETARLSREPIPTPEPAAVVAPQELTAPSVERKVTPILSSGQNAAMVKQRRAEVVERAQAVGLTDTALKTTDELNAAIAAATPVAEQAAAATVAPVAPIKTPLAAHPEARAHAALVVSRRSVVGDTVADAALSAYKTGVGNPHLFTKAAESAKSAEVRGALTELSKLPLTKPPKKEAGHVNSAPSAAVIDKKTGERVPLTVRDSVIYIGDAPAREAYSGEVIKATKSDTAASIAAKINDRGAIDPSTHKASELLSTTRTVQPKSGKTVADYQPLARGVNLRLKNGYRVEVAQSHPKVGVEGVYHEGKTVYIVADNLYTPERAQEVIQHELAHMAGEKVLETVEYTRTLAAVQRMEEMGNANMKRLGALVDKDQPGLAPEVRAKEILARAVEDGTYQKSTTLQRLVSQIVDAFKRIARSMGAKLDGMSEQEVWGAMRKAMAGLEQGKENRAAGAPQAALASVTKADGYNIISNPDRFEAERLLARSGHGEMRGLRDAKGTLHIWDAGKAVHATVAHELGLDPVAVGRLKFDAEALTKMPEGVFAGEPGYRTVRADERDGYSGTSGVAVGEANMAEFNRAMGDRQPLYSVAASTARTSATPAPAGEAWLDSIQRRAQDSMLHVKKLEERIGASEDAQLHRAENLMKARVANQHEDFDRTVVTPLIKRTKDAGLTQPQVAEYLEAKSVLGANARMRELHQDAGATANGVTDEEARTTMAKYRNPEIESIADAWQAITKRSLQMRYAEGIVSKEQLDAYNAAYDYYVPLRGEGVQGGTGKGISLHRNDKRRTGHDARPEWVIENIIQAYKRAVYDVEKNKVGKVSGQLVKEAGNPEIATVGKPERMNVVKNEATFLVQRNGDPDEVFTTKLQVERYISHLIEEGLARKRKEFTVSESHDPYVASMARPMLADNETQYYEDGKAVRIQWNDPLLARAVTNGGVERLTGVMAGAKEFNNFLSKAYTGWNIVFAPKNMIRDMTAGFINLTGDYGAKTAAKIMGNYGFAMKELSRSMSDPSKSALVSEYRKDGGNIGAAYLSDLERIGEDTLAKYHEMIGAKATYATVREQALKDGMTEQQANRQAALKAGKAAFANMPVIGHFLSLMEHINGVTENALRLATYKTLREMGHTQEQAAYAAKNATVNFNTKGEIANQAGALYLFFNASVQGTARILEALGTSKHRNEARALAGTLVVAAFAAAEMNRAGDDEDEKKWKETPDGIRDRNMIFTIGGEQYLLPVPYGYGIFHTMGNAMSDFAHGESGWKLGVRLASSVMENVSPIGNPITEQGASPFQVLPTIPKMVISPQVNENAFGQPITPMKYSEAKPDSSNMYRSTKGTVYAGIAGGLNEITGGSKYEKGLIDVSPETIKYMVNSLTGGTGKFFSDMVNLGSITAQGATPELREVPIVSAFVREPGTSDTRKAFWEAVKEVKAPADAFAAARVARDAEGMRGIQEKSGDLIALSHVATRIEKVVKTKRDLIDAIKADDSLDLGQKREKMKLVEEQERAAYDSFLRIFAQRTNRGAT